MRAILIALTIALTTTSAAFAQRTVALIDGSGSMVPYYNSQLVYRLAESITSAAGTADLALFHTSVVKLDDLNHLRRIKPGGNTYLTDALNAQKSMYQVIWIVTDNVQDTGGPSETRNDMANFYRALQDPQVQFIYVFPLRQPAGTPGLLVYAIATTPDSVAVDKQTSRFLELTKDLRLTQVLMKPLGENAIDVDAIESKAPLSFRTGDVLALENRVLIGPKFPHLYFDSSPARGTKVASPFQHNSCLVPEKGESSISPEFVQTESTGEYRVAIDFGRVTLKPTMECWFQAAFGRAAESEEIQTPIEIQVSGRSLQLSKAFLDEYAADSPEQAKTTGRIHGIRSVPGFVAPEVIHVPLRIPQKVNIRYPQLPGVLLLGGFAVIAGSTVFGTRVLIRRLRARRAAGSTTAVATTAASSAEAPPVSRPPSVKGALRKR